MSKAVEDDKVYPSEQLSKQVIRLSICDAYSPKIWVGQTHFWTLPESTSFHECYNILREGLSRTLTDIPALAGTVGRTSSNPRDLVINIDGNAHVEFAREDLSAHEDFPSYANLKASGFPMTGLITKLAQPCTHFQTISEGEHIITAKLNLLNGGLALAFGFNHLFVDAATLAEIERIWSSHVADVSSGVRKRYRKEVPDEAIRERLSSPVSGLEDFADENWKIFPTTHSQLNLPSQVVTQEAALTVLEKTKKAHLAALNGDAEEMSWVFWRFSPDSLAQLKKDATGSDTTKWISTMDALIGLFWSRLSYIKQASKAGHEKSLVLFPTNIRPRLQPPIDAQYLGNAVDIVMTTHPLSELEAPDTGLAAAARRVREAVLGWSESKWASWLTMATKLPDDQAICPNPLALLASHNMGFNDYSKSQSNTLVWGPVLGRIDGTRYMRPASSFSNCATVVIVHPRLADGGLEVATTATNEIKNALEKDGMFSKYAQFYTQFL